MTTQVQTSYSFGVTLDLPFEEAVERVTAALKQEGFGVLTSIDMKQTLKQKLDVDLEPYTILGACNPPLANRALQAVPNVGLLLPCNVIVYRSGDRTSVEIADPIAMLSLAPNDALGEIAGEARARLQRVVEHLGGASSTPDA